MTIVVSACLLGQNCKYNGGNNYNQAVTDYVKDHQIIAVCPEVEGGLGIPRKPCEICNGIVTDCDGKSWDEQYRKGASICLEKTLAAQATLAILKSRSPSCGVGEIYDGTFSKTIVSGSGIFAQMLLDNGVEVITEESL